MVAAVDEHGADERGNGGKSAGKKSERGGRGKTDERAAAGTEIEADGDFAGKE